MQFIQWSLYPNPNDSPYFWLKELPKGGRNLVLKLGETEQARMNIHRFNFVTAPGILRLFDSLDLSFLTWHAVKIWKCGKCHQQIARSLEVSTRGGYTTYTSRLTRLHFQPEGAVAVFRATQFLFNLRWFSERQEVSCLRIIVRSLCTIAPHHPQSDKLLLGEEVHNNPRHA